MMYQHDYMNNGEKIPGKKFKLDEGTSWNVLGSLRPSHKVDYNCIWCVEVDWLEKIK